MKTMGIDIGTTTVSIVLLDIASGTLIDRVTVEHHAFYKETLPDEKIQDPERIYRVVKENMQSMIDRQGKPDVIGFTGQMHGMLYIDALGNAVSPLYTWQDERSDRKNGDHSSVGYLKKYVGYTAAGYGLSTHFYLQKTGAIPESAVKMVTISDYIAMRLCQCKEAMIGADMAASWGCFDLKHKRFLEEELAQAGVEISYLPKVRTEHFFIGETLGGVKVMGSIGDNQASVFGSVTDLQASVLLNVGTGSQVSVVTDRYVESSGATELRPLEKESYLLAGASLCGGRAYALLEQFYREVTGDTQECYSRMYAQAEDFLEKYGLEAAWKVRTTFSGSRDCPDEKGSISGISTENFHPGALTVGMIMGILEELYVQYENMCSLTGKRASRLVGSGNGLRRNPLMQNLAEKLFGMQMTISAYEEEAACGAALCAGRLCNTELM